MFDSPEDDFSAALAALEENLRDYNPQALEEMCPPAKQERLDELSEEIFGGKGIPDDLVVFFQWHDGQNGFTPPWPESTKTLLSIRQALERRRLLLESSDELQEPWDEGWLPLMENGLGDYLCYETRGADAGSLVSYRHDDERKREFVDLRAWADALSSVLLATDETNPFMFLAARVRTDWKRISPPSEASLLQAEKGTAFYIRSARPSHVYLGWQLFVKLGEEGWAYGVSAESLADALEDVLRQISHDDLESEAIVHSRLREPDFDAQDGVAAEEVGLFRGAIDLVGEGA